MPNTMNEVTLNSQVISNKLVGMTDDDVVVVYKGQVTLVRVTPQALDDIRFKFNPSNLDKVAKLKTLAAAYLSLLTELTNENPAAGREFDIARTEMQKTSMCAVLAATKGL